jgi:solute:Na+ symporter, SSS family
MRIMTTAELISIRYGGRPATVARRIYAVVCCFGFSVLLIGYITGFFAKTIAPIVNMSELQILLIFGGTTALYTMFGGLMGVVVTEVVHFVILMVGAFAFMFIAAQQHGGWAQVIERIAASRPEALQPLPPVIGLTSAHSIELTTILLLVAQGFFFAGSPTAGEGSTAQRFMAARSEAHAMGGQLFNCFLALSLRAVPLIGLGLVALSVFWPASLAKSVPTPENMVAIDPVYAWAELVRRCQLPPGFVGLLLSVEVAAYTSTLSALINWGGSFVINDLYRPLDPHASVRREVWVSRITTLCLFVAASVVAILFVNQMVGWFMFINSAMVIFLLPLSFFRFFWWRFNVWGELAAVALGLPLSIFVWFVLDFQNPETHPMWHGLGLLFGLSFVVLVAVTLLTPPEAPETLRRFYQRCRPPGLWGPVRAHADCAGLEVSDTKTLLANSAIGVLACLCLVIATNAVFVSSWLITISTAAAAATLGGWLVLRVLKQSSAALAAVATGAECLSAGTLRGGAVAMAPDHGNA